MAILLPDQLDDLTNLTLSLYERKNWVDISLSKQHYICASNLITKKRTVARGGTDVRWKVQVSNTGTAKNTEMFARDQIAAKDLSKEGSEVWTKQTVNMIYDVDEPVFQSSPEEIVNELAMRRHSLYNDFFELCETNLWTAPSSSTQQPRQPSGIPHWIQKDATTTPAGAFSGGNPSGFSSGAGGISTSTYANWDNWTFGYSGSASDPQITRDEFVQRARKACDFTKFVAPRSFSELGGSGGSDYGLYTTYRVRTLLEKLVENRNDNLGPDLGTYMGQTLLKSHPVQWVPYLEDNDTSDPFYGVSWDSFRCYFLKGKEMYFHPVRENSESHSVREVHMDSWSQFIALNRRHNFVGSTS